MKNLLLASLMILSSTLAMAGQDKGNGGDACENSIKLIRDDIHSWIKKGGSANLKLGKNPTLKQYNTQMLKFLSTAQVSCTDKELLVGKAEKTCKNFIEKGVPRIVCNTDRFSSTEIEDQYIIIHHEYAGLSGFEVNSGEESQYTISNQLSHYLEEKMVTKLSVKADETLERKTMESFLLAANDPSSEVGKKIAEINEETRDGRNSEGVILLPVTKNNIRVTLLEQDTLINSWKYAEHPEPGICLGNPETTTYLVSILGEYRYSGGFTTVKFNFTVTSKELEKAVRKDGAEIEYCQDVLTENMYKDYIIATSMVVGKFKSLNISREDSEEN